MSALSSTVLTSLSIVSVCLNPITNDLLLPGIFQSPGPRLSIYASGESWHSCTGTRPDYTTTSVWSHRYRIVSLWWLGITRRERIGAMRNRREMAKLQRWCTRRDHLREAALQGKLRKRAGYVWYLIGERTAASQAAWRWSESCSLFQSSDRHKAQNYYHYSVQLHPLVFSNRLEPYSQLIHRCTLRIESPDPILSNGATAQTASLNQQHLRPEILFCLSCLFPSICLILLMSKGQIRWWGESFRLRANCYLCASPVLRTSSLAGRPRHHGPRCTGIGRNKQGVFLKGFVPSWNNTWYRFTELSADMQSTPREILHQQIFAVLARAGCTRTGTYSTFGYALANHV